MSTILGITIEWLDTGYMGTMEIDAHRLARATNAIESTCRQKGVMFDDYEDTVTLGMIGVLMLMAEFGHSDPLAWAWKHALKLAVAWKLHSMPLAQELLARENARVHVQLKHVSGRMVMEVVPKA